MDTKNLLLKTLVELLNDAARNGRGYKVRYWAKGGVALDPSWVHETQSTKIQSLDKGKLLLDGHWTAVDNFKMVDVAAHNDGDFSAAIYTVTGRTYIITNV